MRKHCPTANHELYQPNVDYVVRGHPFFRSALCRFMKAHRHVGTGGYDSYEELKWRCGVIITWRFTELEWKAGCLSDFACGNEKKSIYEKTRFVWR